MKFFFSSKLHQYLIKQIAAEDKEQALQAHHSFSKGKPMAFSWNDSHVCDILLVFIFFLWLF